MASITQIPPALTSMKPVVPSEEEALTSQPIIQTVLSSNDRTMNHPDCVPDGSCDRSRERLKHRPAAQDTQVVAKPFTLLVGPESRELAVLSEATSVRATGRQGILAAQAKEHYHVGAVDVQRCSLRS